MTEIIRCCPDCGQDRPFQQHDGAVGWCPVSDHRYCPEWYCVTCGAALLIGDIPIVIQPASSARIRDRVA